jgi:transcription elongation factor
VGVDNVIKCVEGKHKGKKGVVKHIYNTILFLWDKDFSSTNGLYVEKTRNVIILGEGFIKTG